MWANIVALFVVLFMVFAGSSVSCKGDKDRDKTSGATEYQSLASERKSGDYTIKLTWPGRSSPWRSPKWSVMEAVVRGGSIQPREIFTRRTKVALRMRGALTLFSTSILSAKAKQFDDGLYAAAEIAMQEGLPGVLGKKMFLAALLGTLRTWGPLHTPTGKRMVEGFYCCGILPTGRAGLRRGCKGYGVKPKNREGFSARPSSLKANRLLHME